jgi:hypothetical protein
MATTYPQHANKAQLQREAQPQADMSSAPDNPHWDTKKQMKWQTDAKERITSHSDKVISTSYTARNGTKGCRKHSQEAQGLGGMQSHATSQQTVDEKFELCHREIMKRMVIEEVDERFKYIIRPLQRRLRDLEPDTGYTIENWMACLQNLAVPSVYRGKDPIQETLRRSEPLQELD